MSLSPPACFEGFATAAAAAAASVAMAFPHTHADAVEPELQQLFAPVSQEALVGPSCGMLPGAYGSTRLNSRARAWTPGASALSVPTRTARSQILDILAAMQVAMASSGIATEGDILERPSGWGITMYVHAAHLTYKEHVITLGTTALIENSKRSQDIYAVGYCSQPCV